MANCNDCIHRKVCVILAFPEAFENTEWEKEPCDHFKDADVVPKSEVEKLQNELVIWKQNRFNLYQKLECYETARQKVAMEIFEEIENWFELYSEREYSFAEEEASKGHLMESEAHDYALDIIKDLRQLCIVELKKKYTEDNEK